MVVEDLDNNLGGVLAREGHEVSKFSESINYSVDDLFLVGGREAFYEIHENIIPSSVWDGQRLEVASGLDGYVFVCLICEALSTI